MTTYVNEQGVVIPDPPHDTESTLLRIETMLREIHAVLDILVKSSETQ